MNERLKVLRGRILQILRRMPEGLDKDGLIHVFYQYYRVKEIEEALMYLLEKGYIQANKVKLTPKVSYEVFKITAKGIDVLDATEEDKGIILPSEED